MKKGKALIVIFVGVGSLSIFSLTSFRLQHQSLQTYQTVKNTQSFPNGKAKTATNTNAKSITIKAVGDIIPGTNFPDYRLPGNPNELFPKSIRGNLRGANILFGNYESTLTNYPSSSKDVSRGQTFAFRSPPKYARLFTDVGFGVLSVANNHSMDFGSVGFKDTIKNFAAVRVKTVGEKNQILYMNVENIPVAFIGFCFYDYCNQVQDIAAGKQIVEKARKNAKIVIVSMHVGAEGAKALRVPNKTEFFYGENRGNSISFSRSMIDAGADLVLGHGPHVPRAMEIYQGKLIAYSLGNFLGYKTLSVTGEKGDSMILEVKLNPEGDFLSGKIIPVRLDKQGIPRIDASFRTVKLVRSLIKSDFPKTSLIINQNGEITK